MQGLALLDQLSGGAFQEKSKEAFLYMINEMNQIEVYILTGIVYYNWEMWDLAREQFENALKTEKNIALSQQWLDRLEQVANQDEKRAGLSR